jgi:predicted phage terminase large subunit-like protein
MAPSPGTMYAAILRQDLYAFIDRSFLELNAGKTFEPNWHLEVLATKLKEVADGKCRRLIINIPPRHLKSHSASIAFPAWLLGHDPTKQILSVCYAQDLSEKLARDSRAIMSSHLYQTIFKTRLSPERQSVSDFETTEGGYRFSTSVGGVLTGRGADVIIIDDPLKADDAISDTRRKSPNEWYDNTLRSRLNSQETGAIIIVMQRLHTDDLVAHVQESENWDVLNFPAIAVEDERYDVVTPYGPRTIHRKSGEVLQPNLLSAATLEILRNSMTAYNFEAQYQQNPQPPAGLIVKKEWLKFYSEEEKPAKFDKIVQSWDTANKPTELANFSVGTTWGVLGNYLYLLDVVRARLDFPNLKRVVRNVAILWKADLVLVEDKASGIQLIQELRGEGFNKVQEAPKQDGDKTMRLTVQTARIQGGFALFPKSASWLDTFLQEITSFPNSKYDDQVDSMVNMLAWGTELAAKPRGFFDVSVPTPMDGFALALPVGRLGRLRRF